jgi:hypothetical protein
MTTLEAKTQILSDYWFTYSQDADHADFIEVHDIGIPLATLILLGHATSTPSGVEWINSDFEDLLGMFGVDPLGDFDSLEEVLEISSYE